MPGEFYTNKLYPFQDEIFEIINKLDVNLYLSIDWKKAFEEAGKKVVYVDALDVSVI